MPIEQSYDSDEMVVFEKPRELAPLKPLQPIKLPSVGLKPPKHPQPQVHKSLKDGQVNTNLVMPKGVGGEDYRGESKFADVNYRSSQESPPMSIKKQPNSPVRIKKATAVVNSSRDKKQKKYESVTSPKVKYEGRYDKTPLGKYDNSNDKKHGRYSPLKNYQSKAQNVMSKYGTKPTSKITNSKVHNSYNMSTLPSAAPREYLRDNSGGKNEMVMQPVIAMEIEGRERHTSIQSLSAVNDAS